MQFKPSVWIRQGGLGVEPILTVEEALELLAKWPSDRRGALYYVASNSLQSAELGSITADEARQAFVDFCQDAELLGEDRMAL